MSKIPSKVALSAAATLAMTVLCGSAISAATNPQNEAAAMPQEATLAADAGETAAPENIVPAPTMDTNQDGKPDAWDRDANGTPDAWDMDGDGKPDQFDNDGDGKPDGDARLRGAEPEVTGE